LREVLSVDEELGPAVDELDRFVDDAHARGLLPDADSRQRFRELRQALLPDAMEKYRRLDKLSESTVTPASLWDVAVDPVPALRGLRGYAAESAVLLASVASKLHAAGTDIGVGDRQGVHDTFRCLADLLDDLEKQG
jgi:hypothetical protein